MQNVFLIDIQFRFLLGLFIFHHVYFELFCVMIPARVASTQCSDHVPKRHIPEIRMAWPEEVMMPKYLIEFPSIPGTASKGVEFEAKTPAPAFSLIEDDGSPCHVKLWQGPQLLGDIHRDPKGVWHLVETPADHEMVQRR